MSLEALRRGLLRVAVSRACVDPDRPSATALGGAALRRCSSMGRFKATVQFCSAVDEIKP